jgi:hypothetical protein
MSHREHLCEHPFFQRIKCRFRCSHPQAKLLCRQRHILAVNRQSIWPNYRRGAIITSACRGIWNWEYFVGENLVKVCAMSHREHPCEHSAVQRVKCRFRCSHPHANFHCRQRHIFAVNWQSIGPVWRVGQIITSTYRGILNWAYFVGENLVKVCAMSHREHLCEHPFFQRIKCRFRCSHPQEKLLCKQRHSLVVKGQSIVSIWRFGPIFTPFCLRRLLKSSSGGFLERIITISRKIAKKISKNSYLQRAAL